MLSYIKRRSIEDYLAAIYVLSEAYDGRINTSSLAKALDVSQSTVSETVQKLADKGLCTYIPYKGVKLTESGIHIALKVLVIRRVLECLYHNLLKLDLDDSILYEICSIEHFITDMSLIRMCQLLNFPERCPHGKLIPYSKVLLRSIGRRMNGFS